MDRRTLLGVLTNSFILTALKPFVKLNEFVAESKNRPPLFFSNLKDLSRIRANSKTPLLKSYFKQCLEADLPANRAFLRSAANTRDLIRDLLRLQRILRRESLVYLVNQNRIRKDIILQSMETILQMPRWDYFQNGQNLTIGLQRAPETIIALLFAREVLGGALNESRNKKILTDIAEKGCLPCYRSLQGMQNKEKESGWHFDPQYAANYAVDMQRWPIILNRTNLKAIPTAGLGLGALALESMDSRADTWLELAVSSAKEYLSVYGKDGGYEENLSYADYSLRNLFIFFEAHQRIHGTIDWFDLANFYGFTEFMVCMQMGRQLKNDLPDIVNFCDAKNSFYPGTAFWIANHGNAPLAQFAGGHFSALRDFTDFLWYKPARKSTRPPAILKNKKFDLGWIVCRTGWGPKDNVLAFRSGVPGNHEHADRNSFIFKAYGERMLTDHFGAAYDWRDNRGWLLRLTEAHNAILIDGIGHQYHDGHEGTNPSLAEAKIVRFVDRGEVVWWCSDATQAYHLVNADVSRVMRSLLFIKPNIIILYDQVEKKIEPSNLSARFHPDNRDGKVIIETIFDKQTFTISRPQAVLTGKSMANVKINLSQANLDLPAEKGVFPFIEVTTESSRQLQLVTAFVVQPQKKIGLQPNIKISQQDQDWLVKIDRNQVKLHSSGSKPEFYWQQAK